MSSTIEQIVKQLGSLSPSELRELKAWMENRLAPVEATSRHAAVDSVFGKYAHVPTSVEDFCVRKSEDLELEARSRR